MNVARKSFRDGGDPSKIPTLRTRAYVLGKIVGGQKNSPTFPKKLFSSNVSFSTPTPDIFQKREYVGSNHAFRSPDGIALVEQWFISPLPQMFLVENSARNVFKNRNITRTRFGNGRRRRRAARGRCGGRTGRGRVVAGLGHGPAFVHVHRGGQLF